MTESRQHPTRSGGGRGDPDVGPTGTGMVSGPPLRPAHRPFARSARQGRREAQTTHSTRRTAVRDEAKDVPPRPPGRTGLTREPRAHPRTDPPAPREAWVHGAGSACGGLSLAPPFRTPEPPPPWTATGDGKGPQPLATPAQPQRRRRQGRPLSRGLCGQEGGPGVGALPTLPEMGHQGEGDSPGPLPTLTTEAPNRAKGPGAVRSWETVRSPGLVWVSARPRSPSGGAALPGHPRQAAGVATTRVRKAKSGREGEPWRRGGGDLEASRSSPHGPAETGRGPSLARC